MPCSTICRAPVDSVYSGHLVPVPSDRYERYHGSAPRGTIRPLQRYHRSDILTSRLFRKPTSHYFIDKDGFSKTHQSSLTLKGGSTSHLGLLPSGKKRKPPYSVLKPLRYKASEVCARFFVRDEPHGHGVADGLLDGTALDMGLLMGCLRLHNICHQRSAPGGGQDCTGEATLGILTRSR